MKRKTKGQGNEKTRGIGRWLKSYKTNRTDTQSESSILGHLEVHAEGPSVTGGSSSWEIFGIENLQQKRSRKIGEKQ